MSRYTRLGTGLRMALIALCASGFLSCSGGGDYQRIVIRDEEGRVRIVIGREMRVEGGPDSILNELGVFLHDESGWPRVRIIDEVINMYGPRDGTNSIRLSTRADKAGESISRITVSSGPWGEVPPTEVMTVRLAALPGGAGLEISGRDGQVLLQLPE